MEIKNKTILITGASSGIGKECASLLAKNGANIILVARRENKLKELAAKLKTNFDTKCLVLPLDIQDHTAIEQAFANLNPAWSNIDVLINNAGLALGKEKLQDTKKEDWTTMFSTNVNGLLSVTQKILPGMIEKNSGHIINIGSIAGHEVYQGGSVYCATKHAVRALTKGLKIDLSGTDIRVSSIDPGMVETDFSLVRFNQDQKAANAVYENLTPLTPIDIAEIILFAVTRPKHVNISELLVLPTCQSSTSIISRRKT